VVGFASIDAVAGALTCCDFTTELVAAAAAGFAGGGDCGSSFLKMDGGAIEPRITQCINTKLNVKVSLHARHTVTLICPKLGRRFHPYGLHSVPLLGHELSHSYHFLRLSLDLNSANLLR